MKPAPLDGEIRKKKNGGFCRQSASISPVRDGQGEITQFIAGKEDITGQKRAAEKLRLSTEALQQSEARFRHLVNSSPDAIMIHVGPRIVFANPAAQRMFGADTGNQLEGKDIFELIHPDDHALVKSRCGHVLATGASHESKLRKLRRLDGSAFFGESTLSACDHQNEPALQVLIRDVSRRVYAEQALRESERFLQSTLDALSAHIAILDENGLIIAVNSAWNQFARQNGFLDLHFGVGADYLSHCGSPGAECGADAPAVAAGIRAVTAGQSAEFSLEYPCHSPREQRWFTVRVTRFSGGGPLRVVVAHENITKRKQAEEATRLIERRLAHAMSLAQLAAWEYDVAGGLFTFSDRYYALHGTTTEQEGGKLMSAGVFARKFIHPDDAHLVADEVAKAVATADPDYVSQLEARIFRRDGELRHVLVHISIAKDSAGRTIQLRGANQDITERKKSEQALRNLWRAVEQSPVTVVITNVRGNIEYVNPKFVEITGYRAAEALGQNPRILKSGLHDASFYKAIWDTLLQGNVWKGEIRNKKKNGELYWESVSISPVREPSGEIAHFIAVKEDISARRHAAEQLLLAKEAAESANRAKSEFLAMMSHEIRTPMNGLIGFTDLLLDTPLTAEQQEFARTVRASGQALLTLINDILDFSKIEAGKLNLEAIQFSLADVVNEAVGLLDLQARQKQLDFQVQFGPGLPPHLHGDPVRVRQVLLNLAGNAVKFTRRGRVGVAVRMDPANPEFIRCEVTDTGIGVPREKQAKLFQLFSQADSSTTRRFGGSGLGLAISKRLVELMGGEIGLLSEPGKGSTFWFNLPAAPGRSDLLQKLDLAPQTAAEDKEPAEAPGHPAARAHVLLAEDDPVNQELARYLLKRLSCAVDVAPNGREAVELARRRVYDAVFMDCLMPEMDGLEATRQIRRAENGATRVPIIAVTASVFESQRAECLAAGMDDFIEKPIHADMMEKALQKWVFDPGSRPSKTPSPTTRQP